MSDLQPTRIDQARYDHASKLYDWCMAPVERWLVYRWRRLLWQKAKGPLILEVGVGTGKSLPYYPPQARVVAVDLSQAMLARARWRQQKGLATARVDLALMDAQHLAFADNTFDTVVTTFVFCSVPDPIQGLQEIHRVCKAGGQVLMLEHVLSRNLLLRFTGTHFNRETGKNIQRAGLRLVADHHLLGDMVRLFEAEKPEKVCSSSTSN